MVTQAYHRLQPKISISKRELRGEGRGMLNRPQAQTDCHAKTFPNITQAFPRNKHGSVKQPQLTPSQNVAVTPHQNPHPPIKSSRSVSLHP